MTTFTIAMPLILCFMIPQLHAFINVVYASLFSCVDVYYLLLPISHISICIHCIVEYCVYLYAFWNNAVEINLK